MIRFKNLMLIFLILVLTIGISVSTSQNVFAATLITKTYTVKSGDCLALIAQTYGESLNNLRTVNHKWNNPIFPGQFFEVSVTNNPIVQKIAKAEGNSIKIYTVKSGDCLSLISQTYGESLNDLRKANHKWNDSIFPGQFLNVSVKTSPTVQKSVPKKINYIAQIPAPNKTNYISQKSTSKEINYTPSDLNLLTRLITAESQGESYNAQVAVGAVVVNRVKSSSFPKSISTVINQETNDCYQFTTVSNGSINKPAQGNAVKAAYAALNGNDPTNKALFFYDTSANDPWIISQPVSVRIDKLIFAY